MCRPDNRVAEKVLELNEQKRWNPNPSEIKSKEQRKKQDDEVFGTARLVNCNYFVQMILHDYLQVSVPNFFLLRGVSSPENTQNLLESLVS
jgi:hypothetical protein